MNGFCVDTIASNPHLRPPHGILRAAALPLTANAQNAARLLLRAAQGQADALIADAQREAHDILADAHAQAERLLSDAREQGRQKIAAEEQRVIEQSAELLRSLRQAREAILERVEDIVIDLAQALYDCLVADTTPRERIAATFGRVVQEAPVKLTDALLRVHPQDVALLPEVEWPVKGDATLAPGTCRLEASNGQWCASFDAAVQALKAAFAQGIEDARRDAPQADTAGDGAAGA